MKKTIVLFCSFLLLLSLSLGIPAKATDTGGQNSLEVTLTTNKAEYDVKDPIQVSVEIKNDYPFPIYGVSVQPELPSQLSLKSGQLAATDVEIGANTTYTLAATARLKQSSYLFLWVGLILLSVVLFGGAALVIFFRQKAKKAAKLLSLLLCLGMVLSMLPAGAFAAQPELQTIPVEQTIRVGKESYTLRVTVTVPAEALLDSCTVIFDSLGGSAVPSQTLSKGTLLTIPPFPEHGDLLFAGWYTDPEYTARFDLTAPILKSCTLYARWLDLSDKTDTDNDGLTDPLENYYGTNPTLADTDIDGLNDYVEVSLLHYDPLLPDTDQNGTPDGQEDYDLDGLDNLTELELNTNPTTADTDNDNLTDKDERDTHRTSPTEADTDQDGANDGWELKYGFDPLSSNSSFRVTIQAENPDQNNPVVASVEIDTNGSQASSITVHPVDKRAEPMLADDIPGYLGTAYEISGTGELKNATISFTYDRNLGSPSDTFQPRIYSLDETNSTLTELENQSVSNGVVQATPLGFSKCILLNKVEFDKVWEADIKPPLSNDGIQGNGKLDILFVIDYSSSMNDNDPDQLFKDVAREFIDKLREGMDQAGAVKFVRAATLVSSLTTDKTSLISAINGITYDSGYNYYSGTDGSTGIRMALDQLDTSDSEFQFIVFMTDGEDNGWTYSYDSLIGAAKDSGIRIYTIGMGNASASVLRNIADKTGGKYYHATTGAVAENLEELDQVFDDIESETIDLTTDANGDNLPDYYGQLIQDGTLLLGNGSRRLVGIDFNGNKDYDGDGILNGDEIHVIRNGNLIYLVMESDPIGIDMDQDGFLDYEDPHPDSWDVSYRDLVLLSNAVYQNWGAGTILSGMDLSLNHDGGSVAGYVSELVGWEVLMSVYNPFTGFEGAAYAKDNNIVIATRGSEAHDLADILQDWVLADILGYLSGLNAQLPAMETFIDTVVDRYGDSYDNFYVTGHSLGGYLALMSASQLVEHGMKNKIRSVLTFNGLGLSDTGLLGLLLDLDDNANLDQISGVIRNYRTTGDIVSCIGYTPGRDVTVAQADSLGGWSIGKAHSLVTFGELFSNEQRHPVYLKAPYHGLMHEQ